MSVYIFHSLHRFTVNSKRTASVVIIIAIMIFVLFYCYQRKFTIHIYFRYKTEKIMNVFF